MQATMVYLKNVDVPEALSPGEHARIVSENGHDYVRMLMSSVTGKDYSEVPFSHHPGGKPYFRECPCHFSLSHSGTLLAVAISASDVGIDIEKIGHFSEKVAERIFTGNEKQYYDAGENPEERSRRGYQIWTAKEAYLKLHGVGIAGGLDFDTTDSSGLLKIVRSAKYPPAALQSSIKEITLLNDTALQVSIALCGAAFSTHQVVYHIL